MVIYSQCISIKFSSLFLSPSHMASPPKFYLHFLLLLLPLLLLLQSSPYLQWPSSEESSPYLQWPSPAEADEIIKALWDTGRYKLVSILLKNNLHRLRPCMNMQNKRPITIFLPAENEAFRFAGRNRGPLEYHVVTSKVVEEDFDSGRLSGGSELMTCLSAYNLTVTDHPRGGYSINGRRIMDWNIYSDRNVIVHGIENFFNSVAFQFEKYSF